MSSKKIRENAQKIAYIVQQYPKHTLDEVIALMELPSIDINCAIWEAVEAGYISKPDDTTKMSHIIEPPLVWGFGEVESELEDALLFSFKKLAEDETDLEENFLSQWTRGYAAHDVMIALRQLTNSKQLSEYVIEDGDNSYTFYCLTENRDKLWGRKQFKKDPLAKEPKSDKKGL